MGLSTLSLNAQANKPPTPKSKVEKKKPLTPKRANPKKDELKKPTKEEAESKQIEVKKEIKELESKKIEEEYKDNDKLEPKKLEVEQTEPNKSESKELEGTKQAKKYKLKAKGMKLTEIDEDGDPINHGKRYAIVIGINDYNDTAISKLSKARNDAKATGKILKEIGQFDQVFVMTDDVGRSDPGHLYPTKLNIEEKVESVLRFSTPDDLIVFFFSGHGISDQDGNGYLITVDTVADKKFDTALKVDSIVKKLQAKGIKKSLLVLDACREKLYTSKSSERDSIKEKIYTEAEIAATFYSTKSGYYSYEDDESDYGVFTKHLVYGMEGRADENKDGVVSFSELEQYVNKGVGEWSLKKNKQQKPFTKIYGEKTGDLAITVASNPEKSLVDKKVVTDMSPFVWKSAIIPGWGQYEKGQSIKGKIFGISFFSFSFLLFLENQNYKSRLQEMNKNTAIGLGILGASSSGVDAYFLMEDKKYERLASESASKSQNFSLFLIGIYVWNLLDANYSSLPQELSPVSVQTSWNPVYGKEYSVSYIFRF